MNCILSLNIIERIRLAKIKREAAEVARLVGELEKHKLFCAICNGFYIGGLENYLFNGDVVVCVDGQIFG